MQTVYRMLGWMGMIGAGLAVSLPAAELYVAQNGQTPNPGALYNSWGNAASNIQAAVDAATAGDTVIVGEGTYRAGASPATYSGPNVVLVEKPLTLRGATDNPADVLIDGEGANRCITVTYATLASFTMDGFTITNGYAHNGTDVTYAGGMYIYPNNIWTATVQNCVFTHNVTTNAGTALDGDSAYEYFVRGGGLCMDSTYSAFLAVSNCVFRSNTAAPPFGGGGGLYLKLGTGSGAMIVDSRIEENLSARGGGVDVRNFGSRYALFTNVVFRGNQALKGKGIASYGGGAIHQWPGAVRLWNCLLYNNRTDHNPGGAIYCQKAGGGVELYNCTIVSNHAVGSSGALATRRGTDHIDLYNSILSDNNPADIYHAGSATNMYAYSCFAMAGLTGAGPYTLGPGNVLTNDPGFVDFDAENFSLSRQSPCINAGTNLVWMADARDLAGNPRIDRVFRQADIGCYEYTQSGTLLFVR